MATLNSHSMRPSLQNWQKHISTGLIAAEVSWRSVWLETLAIPLIAILCAAWVRPADPLLLKASFPWLWFAPLLVALRYGVLPGLMSGILLLVEWLVCSATGVYGTAEFPREFFFAGTLMLLLGGQFSDVWRDRLRRIDETNLYLVERLSGLTRRHLLLNLSHDRLEQEMLARPGSLRDALVQLRATVTTPAPQASDANNETLPGVQGLLHLLVQYVNIEVATLYRVKQEGQGYGLGDRLGNLGDAVVMESDDELLQLAFETKELAHIAALELNLERKSSQLVVAPLVNAGGDIVAVLAVSKLPFFSMNVENLQMMSVILAYYADCVSAASDVRDIKSKLPMIPVMHAEELGRLTHMQQAFNISSHIVVLAFRGERRIEMPSELMRIKRGLDLYWETVVDGNPAVVVLMPFASVSAKEGFLARINGWMKTRYGAHFDALDVDIRSIDLSTHDPVDSLVHILKP